MVSIYANFALSFAAVMMTGTRAAFFTFPLMIMVILFLQHRDQKVFLFKGLSGVFILLLACGLNLIRKLRGELIH